MAQHMKWVCQHGNVIRQCRCPSSDKTVRTVDCENKCNPPVKPTEGE